MLHIPLNVGEPLITLVVPMDALTFTALGIAIMAVLFIVVYVMYYNRLFRFRNAAEAELGQIRVAMKKRFDMIEQLLGAVRGYTNFEREVFIKVSELRAGIMAAGPDALAKVEREAQNLFGTIRAVAEAYPDLKASDTVKKLMDAIVSLEDEIGRQRYTYNNIVQEFNTMLDTIPSNVVAGTLSMKKLDYLRFGDEVEAPPKVTGIGVDERN